MRWLLIMLAVGAAGTAGYLGTAAKNSFSGYSREQLELLERELAQLEPERGGDKRSSKASGRQDAQQELLQGNRQLLQEERQRRLYFPLALGVAGLAAVAAFLVRGGSSTASLRGSSHEEARLLAAMGDPAVLREGARHKAAALLGVSPDAPPAVIEAALQAQLQQRDPSQLHGLSQDLKQLVLQQREELVRARDLLLNKAPSSTPDSHGS
ncbi:MAG: hypothetical protein JXB05_30100 [Myxococcaceae bacterium]|nr:hypothetical protein [Myxococcaceae bacterium]